MKNKIYFFVFFFLIPYSLLSQKNDGYAHFIFIENNKEVKQKSSLVIRDELDNIQTYISDSSFFNIKLKINKKYLFSFFLNNHEVYNDSILLMFNATTHKRYVIDNPNKRIKYEFFDFLDSKNNLWNINSKVKCKLMVDNGIIVHSDSLLDSKITWRGYCCDSLIDELYNNEQLLNCVRYTCGLVGKKHMHDDTIKKFGHKISIYVKNEKIVSAEIILSFNSLEECYKNYLFACRKFGYGKMDEGLLFNSDSKQESGIGKRISFSEFSNMEIIYGFLAPENEDNQLPIPKKYFLQIGIYGKIK